MNALEKWIAEWIVRSSAASTHEKLAEKESFFPFVHDPNLPRLSVKPELLEALHTQFRNAENIESAVWDSVLHAMIPPLADEIAHDLIDRDVCVCQLAHTQVSPAILRRLVPLVDEALLTYATPFYCDATFPTEEFAQVMSTWQEHSGFDWLIEKLAHNVASNREKRQVLEIYGPRHPRWDWLESIERGTIERQKQELALRQQWETDREEAHFSSDPTELQNIFARHCRDAEILRELLQNPQSPNDLIIQIGQSRNFQGAPVLRGEAKNALRKRGLH